MGGAARDRRYDLDWLRIGAVLIVVVYHASAFLIHREWIIPNLAPHDEWETLSTVVGLWTMPLLFVISGAGVFFALRSRPPGRFLRQRALRLLVPWALAMLTLVPALAYVEQASHGSFTGSFLDFLPVYPQGLYGFGGNFAWHGFHLWYLEVLFLFTLLLLPVFAWLKSGRGARLQATLGRLLGAPLGLYAVAVPLLLCLLAFPTESLLGSTRLGYWSLPCYVIFFVMGHLIAAERAVWQTMERRRRLSLGLAVVSLLVGLALFIKDGLPAYGEPGFALGALVTAFFSWCTLLAIAGFAARHLNVSRPFLASAGDAVLPCYVLHLFVQVFLAYYIMPAPLPDLLKFLLILGGSLIMCAAVYLGIRRSPVLRLLFGLKAARSLPPPLPAANPGGG